MEQKNEVDYTAPWLKKREQSKQDPDNDFLTMLAELSRGQQYRHSLHQGLVRFQVAEGYCLLFYRNSVPNNRALFVL